MLITAKSQKEIASHCKKKKKKNSDNDSINSGNDTIDHENIIAMTMVTTTMMKYFTLMTTVITCKCRTDKDANDLGPSGQTLFQVSTHDSFISCQKLRRLVQSTPCGC